MHSNIFSDDVVEKSRHRFRVRLSRRMLKTISDVLLILGLVVMSITGVGLYLAPPGKVAKATNWSWLGLDKYTLESVHTYFGFAMLAIGLLHLSLNWRPLKSLLRTLNRPDVLMLMAVVSVVFGGAVAYVWGWLV